jgi:hypothetical protein
MVRSRPKYGPISRWTEESGVQRRATYDLIASGALRAIKRGKSTLVDFDHGFSYLDSLPQAAIKPQNRSKKDVT